MLCRFNKYFIKQNPITPSLDEVAISLVRILLRVFSLRPGDTMIIQQIS